MRRGITSHQRPAPMKQRRRGDIASAHSGGWKIYGRLWSRMAMLEMGWTQDTIHKDYAWFAVTEDQQADYFVRAYQYAADHWRPWMGLMSAIYLPDPAWTPDREEYWWSITLGSGQIGKAFMALANM